MTPIAKRSLLLSGGMLALVAAAAGALVSFDGSALRGVAIGIALGVVNLVVGLLVTKRSLQGGGMKSAMATITGGFGIRLVVLVALFVLFQHSSTVSGPAFALTFVAFFFVYLAAEIVMIEQLRAPGHA